MTKRILAAIDDLETSEGIVPILRALAHDGATIRLLRVAPVPREVVGPYGRVIAYVDQESARVEATEMDELERTEALLDGDIERVVRFGDPTEEILLEAEAFDADLIALAGPRRGRLPSALRPDVVETVARKAAIPTLVVRQP